MKKYIASLFLLLFSVSQAQFSVKGNIQNYANKALLVKIYQGATDKLVNKITTDANGSFSVKIPNYYAGILWLEADNGVPIIILSNNSDVELTTHFTTEGFQNTEFTKGEDAISYINYEENSRLEEIKNQIFPAIKNAYTNEEDEFLKATLKEEKRIQEKLNNAKETPLVKYFSETQKITSSVPQRIEDIQPYREQILKKLINDNDYLEGTGLLNQMVVNYIQYSLVNISDQQEAERILEKEIDELLEKTNIETERGQNVLTVIFNMLPESQYGNLLAKYYDKVSNLTCSITESLSDMMRVREAIKVGSKAPDIKFEKKIGKYNSLYDIKAKKKIVLFWASWCGACMSEIPFIKEYYKNFKNEGGEIVAISLDYDQNQYDEATKELPWINYTDLLRWDTPGAKIYGVNSTPTLFLLDENNNIVKIASHISEVIQD